MKGAALFMNERRIIQTGIDVSRYQGKIDWARVKAGGTGFAIIKCTQGVNTVDPEFHRNMRNCAAVGLPVGAYVYSRARTAFAAAEEAERAAEECAPYHLDYPIAMDFEAAQFLAMPNYGFALFLPFCRPHLCSKGESGL